MSHLYKLPSKLVGATAVPLVLLACVGLSACGDSSSSTAGTAANAGTTSSSQSATTASTPTTSTETKATATTGTPAAGGAQASRGAPLSAPVKARFAAMRACLRKSGVILPQRTGAGVLETPQLPKGMTRVQYAELLRKCGGSGTAGLSAKNRFSSTRFRGALVSFARCLRQNGIDVPLPNTSGKGPIFSTKGIDTTSPKFQQARRKCRSTLVSALRSGARAGGATH